jgi:hypothetical protein
MTASGRKRQQQQAPALAGLLAGLTPVQSAAQASSRERLKHELEAQIQEKKERDRKRKEELKALAEREEQLYQQQRLRAATSQATTASNQYENYTYNNNNAALAQQDQKWNGKTSLEDSNALLHSLLSAIELDTSEHTAVPPTSSVRRTNYHVEQHSPSSSSSSSSSPSPSKLPILNSVSMLVPVGVTYRIYSGNTIDRWNNYGDSNSEDGIDEDIGIDIASGGKGRRDKKTHNNNNNGGGKRSAKGKTTNNNGGKSGKTPFLHKAIHPQTWR